MPVVESVQDTIARAHQDKLGEHLSGIILCGSVNDPGKVYTPDSDVDFIVVLDELTGPATLGAAEGRRLAGQAIGASASNTLITGREVSLFTNDPSALDGKASQALIEAANRPERILAASDLAIVLPSEALVSGYSASNFRLLEQLIRKTMARSGPELSPGERHKLAKIGLIALKMRVQHDSPRRFSDVGQPALGEDESDSASTKELLKFLNGVKTSPESYGSQLVAEVTMDFLSDSDRVLAKYQF